MASLEPSRATESADERTPESRVALSPQCLAAEAALDWPASQEALSEFSPGGPVTAEDLAMLIERVIRWRTANAIRDLRVTLSQEGIALSGHCQRFYHKQLAQHAAMSLARGTTVANQIAVD